MSSGQRLPTPAGERSLGVSSVTRQVLEANPQPQDVMNVAALIESFGYGDRQVEEQFGVPTVFELAETVYAEITRTVASEPVTGVETPAWGATIMEMVGQFFHGLTFALPMAVSIAAMVFLNISFAAYTGFNLEQATALALATLFSFLVTGGFTQGMAYIYYILVGSKERDLVEATLWLMMRWGMGLSVLLCVVLLVLDGIFPILPFGTMAFAVLYVIPLSAMWLSYTGMYVLRREYFLTIATAIAIGVAYYLHQYRHWTVTLAQIAAMGIGSLVSVAIAVYLFRRQIGTEGRQERIVRSRISHLAYGAAPYFAYGILYFAFIFADRLVAFTTNTAFLPYGIWFRGPYELAMDWALLCLILPMGAVEPMISLTLGWLTRADQVTSESRIVVLIRRLKAIYGTTLLIFAGMAIVSLIAMRVGLDLASTSPLIGKYTPLNEHTNFTYTVASVAYTALVIGLYNVLLLFTLVRPVIALRTMAVAILVDFGVGLAATRFLNSENLAVLGLAAGVGYMLVVTTRALVHLMNTIDYTLYQLT